MQTGRLKAFNFQKWIDEHKHLLKPPVGNKYLYSGRDFFVMVIKGPNARNDFHQVDSEEFFIQLKGDIVVRIRDTDGIKDMVVREGETFFIPPNVPHRFRNRSQTEPMKILWIYASAQAEQAGEEREGQAHREKGAGWGEGERQDATGPHAKSSRESARRKDAGAFRLGPGAAGKYAAGCRFTELHFFLSATLGIVLYPRLAECHGRSGTEYTNRLERHFELMLLAGWGSGLLVALTAAAGLPLLFGADYAEAVAVVWIQSGGALLLFSGVARSHHALLTGAGWTLLTSALATLAAQTALAWWLIPTHGLTGAALASGLAAIVGGWFTTAILPPLRPAFLHQTRAFAILLRPWRWKAALRLAL